MLATVTVTTAQDVVDIPQQNPTIADLPGPDDWVSLREAVLVTNNTAGPDTIDFDPNDPDKDWPLNGGTINLAFGDGDAGDLDITSDLIIDASSLSSGLTIDATPLSNKSRIFNIEGQPSQLMSVQLIGLTLTAGDTSTHTFNEDEGGAIRSVNASLTVRDSQITANRADLGGGIFFTTPQADTLGRKLDIVDSTISGNTADRNGGVELGGIGVRS